MGTVLGIVVGAGVGIFTTGVAQRVFDDGLDEIGGALEGGYNDVVSAAGGVKDLGGEALSAAGDGLGKAKDSVTSCFGLC